MSKATRKKKLKQQDFQKKKLKVGKAVQKDPSETLTGYKSRKIAMNEQTLGLAALKDQIRAQALERETSGTKAAEPENIEKVEVQAVLQHCAERLNHYSEQTRKESLSLMAKTLSKDRWLLASRVSDILGWLGKLMIDESDAVRKQAIEVFGDIMEDLHIELVSPFGPLLIAYVCASMTHIRPEIRYDGVKFLGIIQTTFPQILTSNVPRLIENYLSILGVRAVENLAKLAEELDDDPEESNEGGSERSSVNIVSHWGTSLHSEKVMDTAASWRKDLKFYSRNALSTDNKNIKSSPASNVKSGGAKSSGFVSDRTSKKAKKMNGIKLRTKRDVFRGLAQLIEIGKSAESLCFYPWRKPYEVNSGGISVSWDVRVATAATDDDGDAPEMVLAQPVTFIDIPRTFLMYGEQGNQPRLGAGIF